MAKELGQIHTTNHSVALNALTPGFPQAVLGIDIPGELTSQLQRMIRAGNYFKTVGIDMAVDGNSSSNLSVTIAGHFRYYAPTRGRCQAFRDAFRAMAEQMNNQGLNMRNNPMYDFRAPLSPDTAATFRNQATLDGSNGLALHNAANVGAGIFEVHNLSTQPIYTGTADDLYIPGFDTLLQPSATGTDFVLNDAVPFTGNDLTASTDYEKIPFQLSYSTTTDEHATEIFQWRPDPALYVAMLCGQLEMIIEDFDVNNGSIDDNVNINVAVMVSGWKSIMGNPDKKKKSSKKRSRK